MAETNLTASAVINFVENLEDSSSSFYRELAERFAESKETFLFYAKESERTRVLVTRTYQETITDALEACFSFAGLYLKNYKVDLSIPKNATYSDALKTAIRLEDKAEKFYYEAAESSKSLLATIPRAFRKASKNRYKRKLELESMLKLNK